MMMKKNTIQGYLGGGYIQPRSYQTGGRASQLMARIMAGRKSRDAQEAIADATASAQSAKDKILGYGKGFASLASLAAPLVANAILPGSGLLAGAIGKGLVSGGMGALGRFAGEKLGEELSDDVAKPEEGSYGMEQLDKISKYREGLLDDSLERSLASGAVAGVTAGVGDKLKTLKAGQKAASDFKNVATAAGDTARASELYQQSGDTGKLLGNIMGVSDGYTPTNAPIADFLSNQRYSYEPTSQGMGYYLDDLVPNQNTLFAGNQQGGMIGYQQGGLHRLMDVAQSRRLEGAKQQESMERNREGGLTVSAKLLSLLSGANKGQEQIEDIEQSDAPMVDMEEVLSSKLGKSFGSYPDAIGARNKRLVSDYGSIDNAYDLLRKGEISSDILNKERDAFINYGNKKGLVGYMRGGMTPQRNNYRGGGLISMVPFARRIV